MSLKIVGQLFTGPYALTNMVLRPNQKACVFALVSREGKPYDPRFRLIDVAEAVGSRVEFATHPDRGRWEAEADGELGVYFHRPESPEPDASRVRRQLVEDIIRFYRPPHGFVKIDGAV